MKVEVEMTLTKETPNMHKYDEPETEMRPKMRNVYVSKHELKRAFGHVPERIKVTVEEVK